MLMYEGMTISLLFVFSQQEIVLYLEAKQVRFLSSHKYREIGILSLLMITFQKNDS